MIQRHVYIRLAHEYSGADAVREVAERSRKLADVPGVRAIRIGLPSDESSSTAWELCLILDFETMEDVEIYKAHSKHRAYVDDFLRPRLRVIKAWNFEVGK